MKTLEKGKVTIGFEFAKWKRDRMKFLYEKQKSISKDNRELEQYFKGKLTVWQVIVAACCPGHEYEYDKERQIGVCKHCGIVDEYEPLDDFENCWTCMNYVCEGGDIVDYGSTKTLTPKVDWCDIAVGDDFDDDEMTQMIKDGMEGKCKCWIGREYKSERPGV